MDRLRGPPVLNAGNKQQTDPVRFSDRISHKKGMTMNLKNKKGKRLTSTLMAVLMSVSTTLTPVNSIASEMETSSMAVESITEETTAETEVQTTVETTASSEAQTSTSASETQAITEETTAETDQLETESSVAEEVQSSGESAEETSANETRGPDETQENETTAESESETEEVTETETVEETSSEEPTIDLSNATREDILSYIEAIGGDESDAFYSFIGSLGEDDYQLVWMAQYGAQEDQLLENFGFDYDGSSDLDVAKYIHKLSEDELADFTESMTFEQYKRYLSIREMMAEMDEKDFSDVIDYEEFTADRTWDYASYDVFAESLTGVSLQRTEQTMQFYNTYVDPSKVQAGVTTIDGLLDSNADWYSNDYILSLNPEMFKETVPVYYGSDGNYYVVSTVPMLNGIESADYQPATNFYNDSVVAEAFTDIQYLGNGVYRIPSSRYQYCYTEQYVSDAGTLYGVSFGLRIQVLYGFTASGEVKISADVLYPDMTERFLPAVLNLASGTATVKIFNDDYDDTLDNYLVSASINRGESLPEGVSVINNGKTLQFVMGDNCAVGSLDVLIGYNATSKYSMAAQVTTESLYQSESLDNGIALTAQMQGSYLEMARSSVPSDLAVGDKFVYANTKLTITGVNNAADGSGTIHVGATTVPTHDAQEFCLYSPYDEAALNTLNSWFKYSLSDANSASPGYLVQMTTENIQRRAASNGTSVNLGGQKIFGYLSEALGTSTSASGKTLNLEGTQVLLACMHAWHLEANTPAEVVNSVNSFTERTRDQETFAHDIGFGNYLPNIALQCTDVHDGGDGYTYATFKVVTSMLGVRGVNNPNNYQCAFATLNVRYEKQQEGYLRIHKSSANPEITNGNSCYSFDDINYGVFTDEGCVNNIAVLNLDANGYSEPLKLKAGTYYVREEDATPGSGYQTNSTVYTVNVTAGTTSDAPVMCETTDVPLNDPLGIVINKINSDGTTAADLSGAEYTVTYYPKQYTSVAEIEAETDPDVKPTVWVIQTIKSASGYFASLDDTHIVPNSNSAGAVFGKYYNGNYI
ncbi:MAG: collagen binding domain-containing protein, partial [Lachnospiraceae bacterium]